MGSNLEGKVAVVTGAGRGVGRAVALELGAEGASVVVNDFGGLSDGVSEASNEPADSVVEEIRAAGGRAVANYASVATVEGGRSIIDTALEEFGGLHTVVHFAGNRQPKMIFNLSPEQWDAVIKVHLYGAFNVVQPASVIMREQQWGRIILCSSGGVWIGTMGGTNYTAAKAGIYGFALSLAIELAKYNVTANCIGPSAYTRMTEETYAQLSGRPLSPVMEQRDAGTETTSRPEHVAPIVAYLATEEAGYITGQWFNAGRPGLISVNSMPSPAKSIYSDGKWSVDELIKVMPGTLGANLPKPHSGAG